MKTSFKIKQILLSIIFIFMLTTVFAYGHKGARHFPGQSWQQHQAKYIFLFIGDGMALPQITLAEAYAGLREDTYREPLNFCRFPNVGITTTSSGNSFITDSAAAVTAIATGSKTDSGILSQTAEGTILKTLLEIAEDRYLATGLITTTRLTHATSAGFAAHNESRDNESAIAEDFLDSGVDFIAGGGYGYFVPRDWARGSSKREDSRNLLAEFKQHGYEVFVTREEAQAFLDYIPRKRDKVAGLFSASHLAYEIDRQQMETGEPSLAEMTKKGIAVLARYDNGFFMMVEGGRIDHAGHNNDALTNIYDTLAFNDAVYEAVQFYRAHPYETLIVVTGDHETGGLTLGYGGTGKKSNFEYLAGQKMSYERFDKDILEPYKQAHTSETAALEDILPLLEENFGFRFADFNTLEAAGITAGFHASILGAGLDTGDPLIQVTYGSNEPLLISLTQTLSHKAGISWSSFEHTGLPVTTFALGVGGNLFDGFYDNTALFKKLLFVLRGNCR